MLAVRSASPRSAAYLEGGSIGRCEQNTLIVDTVGSNDKTGLDMVDDFQKKQRPANKDRR